MGAFDYPLALAQTSVVRFYLWGEKKVGFQKIHQCNHAHKRLIHFFIIVVLRMGYIQYIKIF
jgi:hypothetical protein